MRVNIDQFLFALALIVMLLTFTSMKIVSWSGFRGDQETIVIASMPGWIAVLLVVSVSFLIGLGIKHIFNSKS